MFWAASSEFISKKAWWDRERGSARDTKRLGGGVKARLVALHLVLGFEHQQVGDVSEGQTEADHLSLCDVVGKLADVDDPGRHRGTPYVTFELLAVIAIGYEENQSRNRG